MKNFIQTYTIKKEVPSYLKKLARRYKGKFEDKLDIDDTFGQEEAYEINSRSLEGKTTKKEHTSIVI